MSAWQDQIFFVRERTLKELRRLPRRGSDTRFRHPVTGLPNENGIDGPAQRERLHNPGEISRAVFASAVLSQR